jgi:TRAP-type C4-dicarboxylate transport system permease small subunit
MWIVYAILPVAMIIMSVRYLSSAWDKVVLLKDKKRGD